MMGITVDEPAFVFGDNQPVLANTTVPGSTLKKIYHILAYLKVHSNTEMEFDPTPVALDMNLFEQQDWSYSPYGCEGLDEELPNNMPKPWGLSMIM